MPPGWAEVEGFFATQRAKTPVGEIPFAMDMVKEGDGSVHGRTWATNRATSISSSTWMKRASCSFTRQVLCRGDWSSLIFWKSQKSKETRSLSSPEKLRACSLPLSRRTGSSCTSFLWFRGKPHADLQMPRVTVPQAVAFFRESNAKNREQASSPIVQQTVQMALRQPGQW